MEALFGNGKKSKPEKKEKTPKKEKTGGLFGKKQTPPQPVTATQETPTYNPVNPYPDPIINNSYYQPQPMMSFESDETQIEESVNAGMSSPRLELISSDIPGAPAIIVMDDPKGYIDIGRASSDSIQPDVCFSKSFSSIGRRHLRIQNQNGRYFAIDLGSANRTFLGGTALNPNVPVELKTGDELCFTQAHPVKYRVII